MRIFCPVSVLPSTLRPLYLAAAQASPSTPAMPSPHASRSSPPSAPLGAGRTTVVVRAEFETLVKGLGFKMPSRTRNQLGKADAGILVPTVEACRREPDNPESQAGVKFARLQILGQPLMVVERADAGDGFAKQEEATAGRTSAPSGVCQADVQRDLPFNHATAVDLKPGEWSRVYSDQIAYYSYKVQSRWAAPQAKAKDEIPSTLQGAPMRHEQQQLWASVNATLSRVYFGEPGPPRRAPLGMQGSVLRLERKS